MRVSIALLSILLGCVPVVAGEGGAMPFPHLGRCGAPIMPDDVVLPEEWAGIWEVDFTLYDCTTEEVIFAGTEVDTICPNSPIEDPASEFALVCTGSADAETMTFECVGSGEVMPGCTAEYTFTGTATRSGDTYEGVSTTTISYVGECSGVPDQCMRLEQSATRTAPPPDPCTTPVVEGGWGTLKAFYR